MIRKKIPVAALSALLLAGFAAGTVAAAPAHAATAPHAVTAPAAHAVPVTLRYFKAEGTMSPAKDEKQCLTYQDLAPGAPLWWEPCQPPGSDARQLFIAIQIKVKGAPAAVLAMTTYVVPSPKEKARRLCVGGVPADFPIASLYDCTEGLDNAEAMFIYGGAGQNRIRNVENDWLSSWDGTGPAPWLPKGKSVRTTTGEKEALQSFIFRGELNNAGGGWEEIDQAPPRWAGAFTRQELRLAA